LSTERLLTEPFVLALPAGHSLASAQRLTVCDLHRQPMLMYAYSAYQPFNELLTGMFRQEKVAPHYVQWLGSTLTILALVDGGVGLTLIPRSAKRIRFDNMTFRETELGRGVESELHMIWHEDSDSPAFGYLLRPLRFDPRMSLQKDEQFRSPSEKHDENEG
jgi:DNA-binding transcriptional LysR family regulator